MNSINDGTQLRYEPALDGQRAVAIIAVMGFHFMQRIVTVQRQLLCPTAVN